MLTQASVYLMIVGTLIAASGDLAFNLRGYTFLMTNNLCTAAQSIVVKQKLMKKVRVFIGRDFNERSFEG